MLVHQRVSQFCWIIRQLLLGTLGTQLSFANDVRVVMPYITNTDYFREVKSTDLSKLKMAWRNQLNPRIRTFCSMVPMLSLVFVQCVFFFAPTRRDKLQHLQVNIPMVTIEHCTWEYSARDLFLFGEGTLSPSFMAVIRIWIFYGHVVWITRGWAMVKKWKPHKTYGRIDFLACGWPSVHVFFVVWTRFFMAAMAESSFRTPLGQNPR